MQELQSQCPVPSASELIKGGCLGLMNTAAMLITLCSSVICYSPSIRHIAYFRDTCMSEPKTPSMPDGKGFTGL